MARHASWKTARIVTLAAAGVAVAGCAEGSDCVALADGTWSADGAAFGMPMQATITADVAGCTFTIDDWNPDFSSAGPTPSPSLPSGGAVDGDQVTLVGDDERWATCVGTVTEDGTSVVGACDDGDRFTMDLAPTTPTTSG